MGKKPVYDSSMDRELAEHDRRKKRKEQQVKRKKEDKKKKGYSKDSNTRP